MTPRIHQYSQRISAPKIVKTLEENVDYLWIGPASFQDLKYDVFAVIMDYVFQTVMSYTRPGTEVVPSHAPGRCRVVIGAVRESGI
jgi:hypothetical protein